MEEAGQVGQQQEGLILQVLRRKASGREYISAFFHITSFLYTPPMSDTEAKGRRKRKDPQSRDFTCKCGKSYLSYAAAYTHVKNKHDLDKEYVNNIAKPERQQLKRGRPKEKKENSHTYETAMLTLTESAILKICTQLQHVFPKTILEGNEERSQKQFEVTVRGLWEQCQGHIGGGQPKVSQKVAGFCGQLNKDFPVEIAARIEVVIGCLVGHGADVLQELEQVDLWRGEHVVNKILFDTFTEWDQLQLRFDIDDSQRPPI